MLAPKYQAGPLSSKAMRVQLVAALILISSRVDGSQLTPVAGSEYVDSAVCASCHKTIAESYARTGMGRSFSRAQPSQAKSDQFPDGFYHALSDRHYRLLNRGGQFFLERHEIGFEAKETNRFEKEFDYVLGSGDHAQSYLSRTFEGKLIELPMSWYAENGGSWAMSPGYDRRDQKDFGRAISNDCMFCHNAYPKATGRADLTGDEAVFPNSLPNGIDCQRCHGPGGSHVALVRSGHASIQAIRSAIVNPARLGRDRQLEVCMQCHLETSSHNIWASIRRYDRRPFSYRPGEPLGEYRLYFDSDSKQTAADEFDITQAAYRLRQSDCFKYSGMTCTTCHDPHRPSPDQAAAGHYLSACRTCHPSVHAAEMPAKSNCLPCHMPMRRVQDAVHVVMTDHFIQIKKPARELLAPLHESESNALTGEVELYYPPALKPSPESNLYLAIARLKRGAELKSDISRVKAALQISSPKWAEPYFEVGAAYSTSGNKREAIDWFGQALLRRPDFHPALERLVEALFDSAQSARAVGILEKSFNISRPDSLTLTNLGNAYLRTGRLDRAESTLTEALGLNPDSAQASNLMGLVQLRRGDRTRAGECFRNAISIHTDLAEAHNNLANLLGESRRYAEARYHFEKAITSDPSYAQAHHSYGLLLEVLQAYPQAEQELRTAVGLAPKDAQSHIDLGDILAARGENDSAAREYERAVDLQPGSPEAHYGLGNARLSQAKIPEAINQFRSAIQADSSYYEARLALGLALLSSGHIEEARQQLTKTAESPDPGIRSAAQNALLQANNR